MPELEFAKSHGLGNDFIIADGEERCLEGVDLSALAVRLCDRNFGIGGDGFILVLPSNVADYRMQIINSDGSEAEMCGNGLRCFVKYLVDRGVVGDRVAVETLAGIKTVDIIRGHGETDSFVVNMGKPKLDAKEIPVEGYEGRVIAQPLEVDGVTYTVTCVNMGNPHCVIFLDSSAPEIDRETLRRIGPRIETHPMFPKKTNVEFARVLSKQELRVDVWERGAGVTLACGTGACATVVAGVLNGLVAKAATVHLPGGDLQIEWKDSDEVYMTGPAVEVFRGKIDI